MAQQTAKNLNCWQTQEPSKPITTHFSWKSQLGYRILCALQKNIVLLDYHQVVVDLRLRTHVKYRYCNSRQSDVNRKGVKSEKRK